MKRKNIQSHRVINFIAVYVLLGTSILISSCHSEGNSSEKATAMKVETFTLNSTSTNSLKTYVGTVEESEGSSLSFAAMGTVQQVYVETGQQVTKGQILARLDKASAHDSYTAARASLQQAEDSYRRLHELHEKGSLPEIQYVEVQTKLSQAKSAERIAKKVLTDCILRAPYSGLIANREIDEGQNVIPGQSAFRLVKIDRVEVKIPVPENEISDLKVGQKIQFTVTALGSETFTGVLKEKGVVANPLSHTYEVKIVLQNPGNKLMPGMVCSVHIDTLQKSEKGKELIIASEIVSLDANGAQYVWTVIHGKAHKQNVTVGEQTESGVQITSGLSEGDVIIIKGQQKVSEGTPVQK
ncbi:MAG: efflux RND transporter periplasmic adaptor subunit [Bacteroidaceae bacterium]|nr:efflux RND transporter periplasmic adaptor subunit [Bacteroidaceae bacterium]MBP9637694.1 efflux RND transporter periplasmic adaptor subunit [Bacteroidaceae bacterium]